MMCSSFGVQSIVQILIEQILSTNPYHDKGEQLVFRQNKLIYRQCCELLMECTVTGFYIFVSSNKDDNNLLELLICIIAWK